jgi:protein-tyrosine phosphatase
MTGAWLRRARRLENGARNRLAGWEPRREAVRSAKRFVFVCKGNICRSAFAEALWRETAPDVAAISVGLETDGATPSPPLAIQAASMFGVDLEAHRSRRVAEHVDAPGDVYLVMEPWHRRASALAPARRTGRVELLGLWGRPPIAAIADPLGGAIEQYRVCFRTIATALERLRDRST